MKKANLLVKEDIKYSYPDVQILITTCTERIEKKVKQRTFTWSDLDITGTLQVVFQKFTDMDKFGITSKVPPFVRL